MIIVKSYRRFDAFKGGVEYLDVLLFGVLLLYRRTNIECTLNYEEKIR
jgi:hypothetical protein